MLRRVLAALMFLVCTDTAPFAEPVTIRMMTPYPTGTPLARGIEQFATTVNRALEGIARLDLVPPAGEILNIVRSGEVALAAFPSDQYAPSEAGRFALFELPFVFDDLNRTANVQESAVGETMLAAVTAEGLLGLGYWNVGMARLFGPVEDPKGFAELTIRSRPSAVTQAALRRLGARPVPIAAANQWVPAVISGEIRAYYASPPFVASSPLREKATSFIETGFVPQVLTVVANGDAWRSLSFQIQSVLADEVRAAAERMNLEARERDASALSELGRRGFKTAALSASGLQELRNNVGAAWNISDAAPKNRVVTIALAAIDQQRREPIKPPPQPQRVPTLDPGWPVLFATDRKREPAADPNLQFGRARGDLVYGAAAIDFGPGRLIAQGTNENTRIAKIDVFAGDKAFAAALSDRLKATRQTDVLIYVHGYRNTFRDAVQAGAFMTSDIKFKGVPVVFSWPSEGTALDYIADGNQARKSRDSLVKVLTLVKSTTGVKNVHIVVHSMGGRVVADALEWMTEKTNQQRFLGHLVFAAPDVDSGLFTDLIKNFSRASTRTTLYASTFDQALVCSRLANDGPRAGLAGDDIVLDPKLDTIDVTKVENPSVLARLANLGWTTRHLYYLLVDSCRTGHSYVTRNLAILNDLNSLIIQNSGPDKRIRLQELERNGTRYWEFLPAEQ